MVPEDKPEGMTVPVGLRLNQLEDTEPGSGAVLQQTGYGGTVDRLTTSTLPT
jgi:hypothetical protein